MVAEREAEKIKRRKGAVVAISHNSSNVVIVGMK